MTCNPTTPGTGRWNCETCGANLGTSEGKAVPDFARCPDAKRLRPENFGDLVDEPDDDDYNRGIADAVAVIDEMLNEPFNWEMQDHAFARARDAVAALKRGDA